MHRLLKRQLKKFYGGADGIPEDIAGLIEVVDRTYRQFDEDREMLDRSLRLGSQELVQRNSEMRAVFQAFPDTFVWINPWGTILDCKGGMKNTARLSPEEILGKKIFDIPIAGDRAVFGKAVEMAVRSREVSHLDYSRDVEGTFLSFEARFIPLSGDMTLVIFRDITRRKQNEEELIEHRNHLERLVDERTLELKDARDVAQAANAGKDEFLANISHEMRTPLNGIMGMLQLAAETRLDREQSEFVGTALTSCRNLLRIINDVLDFSKMEAGRMEVFHQEFRLSGVVDPVVALVSPLAAEKGISIDVTVDDQEVCFIGDEGRLRQMLFNLVGNAVKFTNQGGVKLTVRSLYYGPSESRLLFTVSDTGIGIADDKIDYLFKAFTQADGSFTRRYQGTGLGLGIVKRLVGLMGGNISVSSEEGVGTTVNCSVRVFPSGRSCPVDTDVPSTDAAKALSILLAEDDRINRIMVCRMLEKDGHTVTWVSNGQEAIDKLRKTDFDCVLMDVQMPVMDGVEATRAIRAGDFDYIPIIGLTAHAMQGDRERFLEAGMDDCLTKPFERAEMQQILAKWSL